MTSDAVDAFVREARAFSTFVQTAAQLSLAERLQAAHSRLLALYTAALALPAGSVDEKDDLEAPGPPDWPGFADKTYYWAVFDPYVETAPDVGDLSDDVLDIYRDIQEGFALWDADRCGMAIWAWRFSFAMHWGNHAIDALRALHHACVKEVF